MYRINQLLGKTVINQATGERLASVNDVVLSEDSRLVIALLLKGNGLLDKPQVVRWGAVQSIADVIVVRAAEPFLPLSQDDMIADLQKRNNRITGLPLIGADGQRVGTVRDIYIDLRGTVLGFEIDPGGIFAGHKFLPVAQMQNTGKDAMIASDPTLQSVKEAEAKLES